MKRETLADTVEYAITGTKTTYTIRPGESLVRVAFKFYGNKKLWPYLVQHNKDIIKNADVVILELRLKYRNCHLRLIRNNGIRFDII